MKVSLGKSKPRILVVGAGVAGIEFMLALRELAPDRADVEVVSPEAAFSYRPFAVAETFGFGPCFRLGVGRVSSDAGATFRQGCVVAVDPHDHAAVTAAGERLAYDLLMVACGARPQEAVPGALTFRGEDDTAAFGGLLEELEQGRVRNVVFAVPAGATWPLPLYELALMTAARLKQRGQRDCRLALATPEARPLGQFEEGASEEVADLLESAGIELHCRRYPDRVVDGRLRLVPDGSIEAERVVALPRLLGPQLAGLPHDPDGFVRADLHGRVRGLADVYAAGDATSFPLKQGGIAVQQADAAARAIAARLGAPVKPRPFEPLLRGLLLTGRAPQFLHTELGGGHGETSTVAAYPLWWPPSKIAGGHLADYLREAGLPVPPPPAGPATVPIAIEVPAEHAGQRRPVSKGS
jgi:sulfide:quinone oxidoreductase